MSQLSSPVEFWFDPICPFTWITSRWVTDVAEARGYDVMWNPFSLKILNEGLDEDPDAEENAQGHRMGRVVEAVRTASGQQQLASLYTAIGERLHLHGRTDIDAVLADALAEVGLPGDIISAADRTDADAGLRASTDRVLEMVGRGVGIPIIAVDGIAFFGPVFTSRPHGEQALDLWDAYVTLTRFPRFFELKREITGEIAF